ncbi:MAG: hypothetical protein HYV33_05155 [Candidatus Kerfeldbacteria bacterium]|nr:hypothetical protein [Candidatus Kerfeldbacteria bacterium]
MKKVAAVTLSGVLLFLGTSALAKQIDDHTVREEAEGKIIWQQLQDNEVSCAELTDDNFGSLGEYYMGLMVGNAHESMNLWWLDVHDEQRHDD